MIGGAASNLADRVILGAVRDFIPTPVVIFNIADVAVLVGVTVYLQSMIRVARARPMTSVTSVR